MKHFIPLAIVLFISFGCGTQKSEAPSDAAGSVEQIESLSDDGSEAEPTSDDPCDQFLSEYENWTNRYLETIQQYKQNPTDMSLVQKFTDMANETAQWSERAPQCTEQRHLDRIEAITQQLTEAANLMMTK